MAFILAQTRCWSTGINTYTGAHEITGQFNALFCRGCARCSTYVLNIQKSSAVRCVRADYYITLRIGFRNIITQGGLTLKCWA